MNVAESAQCGIRRNVAAVALRLNHGSDIRIWVAAVFGAVCLMDCPFDSWDLTKPTLLRCQVSLLAGQSEPAAGVPWR